MTPTAAQQKAFEAFTRLGSKRAAAAEIGINESTLRQHLAKHDLAVQLDPAVGAAMQAAGMADPSILHSGWLKTETASLYFQQPKQQDSGVDDIIDRVRAAMDGIAAAPVAPAPQNVKEDLLTLYPIFDLHLGMRAFAAASGEEYTTQIAADRLINAVQHCVNAAPASGQAIILIGGDFLHHNDATNLTKSGHILDVDTHIGQTIDAGVNALATAIDIAATRHIKVTVAVIPGNHDRDAYLAILFAMRERYRDNPRIEVQKNFGEFFVFEFGLVLIASHHGVCYSPL